MLKKLVFNKIVPKIYKFYLSINLKTKPLELMPDAKCLCIAPHADDESIGMGATLYKYSKQFKVVCLTNGAKGIKSLPSDEAMKLRKHEFSCALLQAGVNDFEVLDINDKNVISEYDEFSKIDISNYDYIFIPNILDQHMDHKAVSINLNKLLKEKKHKPNLQIMMYEVWSSLTMPNVYVDISDVIEKKKEIINCHKSQVEQKDFTTKAVAINCYRGLPHDIDYAEAFVQLDVKTFEKLCKETV